MLVTSHKIDTFPGTEKEAVWKCWNALLSLNMHMSEKCLLHNLYKCSFTVIKIIFLNDLPL